MCPAEELSARLSGWSVGAHLALETAGGPAWRAGWSPRSPGAWGELSPGPMFSQNAGLPGWRCMGEGGVGLGNHNALLWPQLLGMGCTQTASYGCIKLSLL